MKVTTEIIKTPGAFGDLRKAGAIAHKEIKAGRDAVVSQHPPFFVKIQKEAKPQNAAVGTLDTLG